MSSLSRKSTLHEAATASVPIIFKKECALTDLFTVSGLFPSTDEANVNNFLVRQHLLHETRQELQGILSKVPYIRMFYTRHCGSNTPPGARRRTLKKRVLPPIAYTNIEPRKSESSETIACVETVSELAALNTNERNTVGRAIVCHQSKLFHLSGEELAEIINTARKAYKKPCETQDTIDMREAVKTLYNLETESPFMKTHDQWLARVRAQMRKIAPSKEKVDAKPESKKHEYIPRLKAVETKSPEKTLTESESSPRPYISSCFLGKKRVFPAKHDRELPVLTTIPLGP